MRKAREASPDKGGAIPAVALTAYWRAEDRFRALSAGFHMHGAKPVEPDELAVVILSLIKRGDDRRLGQLIFDAIAYAPTSVS
jgi:CheY-like chemotaxis protein